MNKELTVCVFRDAAVRVVWPTRGSARDEQETVDFAHVRIVRVALGAFIKNVALAIHAVVSRHFLLVLQVIHRWR